MAFGCHAASMITLRPRTKDEHANVINANTWARRRVNAGVGSVTKKAPVKGPKFRRALREEGEWPCECPIREQGTVRRPCQCLT